MADNNYIVETFCAEIARQGFKQKDIAQKIGVSEDRLSRVLLKKSKMTALEFICICKALKINPNVFREI